MKTTQNYNMAAAGRQTLLTAIERHSSIFTAKGAGLLRFWLIVIGVLALDQGSKLAVQRFMEPGASVPVVGGFLKLSIVYNPGGAFGILGGRTILLVGVSVLALVLVLAVLPRIIRAGYGWPVGLLCGGALGNLIDRLRYGKVIDFIDFGFWPVFNAADIAIVAGALLLGLLVLRRGDAARGERRGHP